MKKKYLLAISVGLLFLSSCADVLDRYPLDAIGDESFFNVDTDLKYYMNGMYQPIIRVQNTNIVTGLNPASDDLLTNVPNSSLMQHSSSGLASTTNTTWNDAYAYIRKCNYFLLHAYKVKTLTPSAQHFIGEGYYCRASRYFDLLVAFGDVPYFTNVLDVDSKELYQERAPRKLIAEKIIADLDSAIAKLNWKGTGEAVSGRINKEAALTLKTRVALFEGTWEYYHGKKDTPFKVSGSDGKSFLLKVVEAGNILMEKQGVNIYRGSSDKEYFDYFSQKDYTSIAGAFLFKAYSRNLGMIQRWSRILIEGYNSGLTLGAVENYLMKDGKPAEISSVVFDPKLMNSLAENKDPRLGQTIWYPARGRFYNYWNYGTHGYKCSYPGLIQNQQRQPAYTGYRIWKWCNFDPLELENGEHDDLIMRYEEALLNYAEAQAILKTITQEDLDKTINLIRSRVNMPSISLAQVNSWTGVNYSTINGFEPTESNIVNEIRRERRVELMLEGFRLNDIKRWALFEEVFNGVKPVGAHVQEFLDYWNDPTKLQADGFDWVTPDKAKLVKGSNYNDINGYINPFFNNADFKDVSGRGYYINPKRDYLQSVPSEEIKLYKDKANVLLTQNPGWFN